MHLCIRTSCTVKKYSHPLSGTLFIPNKASSNFLELDRSQVEYLGQFRSTIWLLLSIIIIIITSNISDWKWYKACWQRVVKINPAALNLFAFCFQIFKHRINLSAEPRKVGREAAVFVSTQAAFIGQYEVKLRFCIWLVLFFFWLHCLHWFDWLIRLTLICVKDVI